VKCLVEASRNYVAHILIARNERTARPLIGPSIQ
jgi:hypothetical protein